MQEAGVSCERPCSKSQPVPFFLILYAKGSRTIAHAARVRSVSATCAQRDGKVPPVIQLNTEGFERAIIGGDPGEAATARRDHGNER